MALSLTMKKGDEQPKKLQLNLSKGARFRVELYWDSPHDLDALLATNGGAGAKVDALEQVLSTYNIKKPGTVENNGILVKNADGKSFNLPGEALHHSGDARTGVQTDIDEVITIDGSKIVNGANEIPIVVTIHEAKSSGATFGQVSKAGIRIKDDSGKVLGEYELSKEFAGFNAVQMGSLILGANGWEYAAVGSGFNGDFETVLGYFS